MSDSKQAVHSFFQPRKPQKPSPASASTPNDPKRPDSAKTKKVDSTQKTDATPSPPAARLNTRLQQQRAPKQTHQEQQRQHGEPAASFNGYVKKGECSTPYYAPMTRPKFHSDALEHQAQASYEENQRRAAQKKRQKNDHEFSRMNRRIFGNGHITDKTFEAGGPCSLFRHRKTATAVDLQQYVKDHQHEFFQQRKHTRERHKCKNSCSGDVHMPLQISQHDEVEEFLSECFPSWHKFSSCVMLLQSIFDDRSRRTGDSSNKQWIDKYRPRHLNGLLGERHNYRYIKDWLHQMKIEPLSAPTLSVDKSNKKHIKKKKKKHKKLVMQHDEDFDDEEAFLKSLSLYEDESDQDFMLGPHSSSSSRSSKKELKKGSMRSNMILLVGDHGIGKTACVYTIAEQMDYEVFEINAGSRRSGKDIMSAVGEMTKSHLVAFGIGSPASASSLFLEKPSLSSTASAAKTGRKKRLNPSLRSPPLGTMTANTKLTLKDFLVKKKTPSLPPLPPVSTPPPTKQSLILLEEVDVLFEEDKGFWASVVELSQNSKRPIIMTCNDAEQVPIENMSLQVIIDMKPPTENELLAYLWLVCFAEGYTVDPADLVCLVAFLGRDIRQLIQTLELYAGQGIFGHYLGLSRDMDMVETKSRCVSSRVAIDTFRLGRSYQRLDGYAKNEETEDLDGIEKILDNNAYIDTWLRWKERGTMVQESVQDQLNGYTTLWIQEDQEDSHQHVSKELQCVATVLNSSRVEWIMDEESHWDELCDASNIHYDDCREAIERVLPVRQAYQPNEQTIMMEYVPYIQQMAVPVDKHHKSRTRSKRKRIHLPLDQDALATLTNPKPPIDEVC
ncbi:hypothetical protein [Parasitella parasitica]|uniref:AAA+ ATPase domain-containing protein n=1 Tax=Parasitella parasitica TaxID=35722 RepID=A0A0B7MU40_9FUNG|nr:hypothetical protein [Parasitella parasitica]